MGTQRGYETEKRLLGRTTIYPGHPVVMALLITHLFDDLASAATPTEHGWSAAVGSSDIPGGGGEVASGLNLLIKVAAGECSLDEAIAWGDERWALSKAGGHADRVEPGQCQAELAKPLLRTRLQTWPMSLPKTQEPSPVGEAR